MNKVPPTADRKLLTFVQNFVARILPTPTIYGLVASEATQLGNLATDFDSRLTTATEPLTRTKGTIAAKDVSKFATLAKLRELIRKVNA